jgi:hypothetical protein
LPPLFFILISFCHIGGWKHRKFAEQSYFRVFPFIAWTTAMIGAQCLNISPLTSLYQFGIMSPIPFTTAPVCLKVWDGVHAVSAGRMTIADFGGDGVLSVGERLGKSPVSGSGWTSARLTWT